VKPPDEYRNITQHHQYGRCDRGITSDRIIEVDGKKAGDEDKSSEKG
jgi:hypothetical protein